MTTTKTTLLATFADGSTETRTTAHAYTACAVFAGFRADNGAPYRRAIWSRSLETLKATVATEQRRGYGEAIFAIAVTGP